MTAAIVVTILVMVYYVTQSSYRLALGLEEQAMQQTVRTATQAMNDYIDKADATVRTLSIQNVVRQAFSGDVQPAQARFENFLRLNKDIWAAFVFDAKGVILAGANADGANLTGQLRADRDYVQAIRSGQEHFLSRTTLKAKSGSGDHYIFTVAQVVKDADGKLLGGVGLFPRWDAYTAAYIDPHRFGERGYGFMLDPQGRIIAHAADKTLLLGDISGHDFVRQALERKKGSLFYDWKGERKYLAFATDPRTGWLVCMSAYVEELTATATQQRNLLLVIGAASILLLVGAITLIVRRLVVRPIRDIEAFTGRIAQGDFKAELRTGFKFELHSLAENIRVMVGELKDKLGFAQGVLDGFVLPCAVFDRDNKATFINPHMMQALDKDGAPESHYGQTSGSFVYGDPGRETLTLRALREKRRLDGEIAYTTHKGATKIFDVTSTPINDLDGNLLGTLAIWFELTEIRAQQKRIEEQHAKIAQAAVQADTISDQVASASEELSAQIEQSSRGSEEQRSRTGEAATAMEEMNATVMEVARSASTAAELADKAKAKAQEGASLVDGVVSTINRISTQAEELKTDMTELGRQADGIGRIMQVIEDIADQTNLLALNAAIEAARAGDAGRGFAVVADEVRKLAEKTMTATNEVGSHIRAVQDSARKNIQSTEATTAAIHESTATANQSGAALREIVDMVEKTADQVRGIATASEQQSSASEEINRSTDEINRIASETAEAMTQSAQAVSDLARLAQGLKNIIHDMQS